MLWVLDLVKWAGQWMVECEREFRAWFLASRLAELPTQPYFSAPSSVASPLVVLPTTHIPAPLTLDVLAQFLPTLARPATTPALVVTPSTPSPVQVDVPLDPAGVLLFLDSAHYDSGLTALVGWVPAKPEPGEQGKEGLERLYELVAQAAEGRGEVEMQG